MNALEVIGRKRDGHEHSADELRFLVAGHLAGSIPDYQVAAWLMAVVIRGMTRSELALLTRSMLHSGEVLDLSALPAPKVESVLVRIDRRPVPAVPDVDRERLFRLVAAGFGQRRKMLRRALAGVVAPEAFACAGIRPEARAEELGVGDWGRLAACSP